MVNVGKYSREQMELGRGIIAQKTLQLLVHFHVVSVENEAEVADK